MKRLTLIIALLAFVALSAFGETVLQKEERLMSDRDALVRMALPPSKIAQGVSAASSTTHVALTNKELVYRLKFVANDYNITVAGGTAGYWPIKTWVWLDGTATEVWVPMDSALVKTAGAAASDSLPCPVTFDMDIRCDSVSLLNDATTIGLWSVWLFGY